jgi:energy-coupling factor transporter ATP-binding protein EcfA2
VLAVDHLSFDVDPGTVTGFLGPNGAGKTTTLRMLLGLVSPTSGRATIDGRPYRELLDPGPPARRPRGLVWLHGVETMVVGVLHRPGLGRWLPSGADPALTAPGGGTLPGWAGDLVFAAYGLALVGGRLVVRRDVS